jgi:hypothetical protein
MSGTLIVGNGRGTPPGLPLMIYIHAQADMERWVEEAEILEEKFRWFIRFCEKMEHVWTSLSTSTPQNYSLSKMTQQSGYKVYALQKPSMYRQMAIDGHENFLSMGRSWPSEHKNLCKYVAH